MASSTPSGPRRRGAVVDAPGVEPLPGVTASPDPADNVLLAIAQVGSADYLVTGDKRHLLALKRHGKALIVTVRTMLEILEAQK